MGKNLAPESIVDELLELYGSLLIPFMKVRRDMPFPTEPERQETDGEHAFTLAMIAITLAERLGKKLDTGLIAKYALVHDLVEAHAGDISARQATAAELEAKAQIEHEAFLLIKERHIAAAPWIPELIERYEARQDEEARFVNATDKIMGAMARLLDDGTTWADYYPEPDGSRFHLVVKRLRSKAEMHPEVLEIFDAIHDLLDSKWPEYLKKKGRPS